MQKVVEFERDKLCVKLKLFKHVIMSNARILLLGTRMNIGSSVNKNFVMRGLFSIHRLRILALSIIVSRQASLVKVKYFFIAIYLSVILQSPLPLFLLYLYSFRFFIWLIITSENGENSNTCLNCQCLKI